MKNRLKTLTAAVALVAITAPAFAQVRSGTGVTKFDGASAAHLASMVESNSRTIASALQRVDNVETTVEAHEIRIGNVEIKAISEVESVTAYNGAWAVCPEGATAFLCMGTNPNNVTLATQPSGHYCNGSGYNQMTASCLKIGITAAAVAEAEGGE